MRDFNGSIKTSQPQMVSRQIDNQQMNEMNEKM